MVVFVNLEISHSKRTVAQTQSAFVVKCFVSTFEWAFQNAREIYSGISNEMIISFQKRENIFWLPLNLAFEMPSTYIFHTTNSKLEYVTRWEGGRGGAG